MSFEKISPEDIENAMKCIGKDWMLITVDDEENGKVNAMTASWGGMGVLWNKNVLFCFVRPERYTYDLLENKDRFSVAFLSEDRREALRLCGRESGRDTDKLKKAGLSSENIDGVPVISEARLVLVCRKLYRDRLSEEKFIDKALLKNYENGGFHEMYVCEIESSYRKID